MSAEEFEKLRLTQGRPPFGVELRIVDESTNQVLANDGHTQGNLQIRVPWIVDHYFNQEKSATTTDGWFDTGDIATLRCRRLYDHLRPCQRLNQIGR